MKKDIALFSQSIKNKRIRILGIFIVAFALFLESPLRFVAHRLAEILMPFLGEGFLTGKAEFIIREIFTQGSPFFFVYFPAAVGLIIIIKDGLQKIDWLLAPFLTGILFKAGIYNYVSLKYQSGEFWRLLQVGVPQSLLYFFIFLFFLVAVIGILAWIENILQSD